MRGSAGAGGTADEDTAGGFVVRRTIEEDWREVRGLRLEMLADTPLAYLETVAHAERRSEAEWRAWARDGSAPDAITAVAITDEGRWVASMTSKVPRGASGAFLFAVYVSPSHRGRAAGVTDAVLTRIEEWARERGDTLTLEVHEHNDRAVGAYRSRGFVETGVTRPYPLDPSSGRELEMRKRLA
ncbi:GNAT family N-acetyltransferase [Herbiconiux solani]|uniref:GNAT family N-acetyltransferase n=1 Tax=Herbiconiux solani TaxID=661329 RepID=UPI000825F87B|nr:GNAT family N-acetyltransferase [Herbiconiux solani]